MKVTTRPASARAPLAALELKPLCAAFLLAFGLGASPIASALIAPNVADTFYSPALGNRQPNNAQLPYLRLAGGNVVLVRFDLSTLPAGTRPEDVQRASAIFAVQNAARHGGIDAHLVLTPSRWSEMRGVEVLTTGAAFSRHICKADEGHEHFITVDMTEAEITKVTAGLARALEGRPAR